MKINKAIPALFAAAVFTSLAGCATAQHGGFSKVDTDKVSHSIQVRYKPQELNQGALNNYIHQRCERLGFDKVDALPEEKSTLPGFKTRWFQCNYAIKS